MNNNKLKIKFLLMGLPAFAGFSMMYLYPFVRTLWYSVTDNTFKKEFVFFSNYLKVLNNQYFRLALKNTFIFAIVGVTCIIVLSLAMSFGLLLLSKRLSFIKYVLLSPMILPTASVIFVWQTVFQNERYIANYTTDAGFWVILPMYLLYIWKNTGLNIIIISAAISKIPPEIHEASALDGASGFRLRRSVTLPLITPSLIFVIVLSFVGALRNFRESYLFFETNYPPDAAYTIQYYMNNHFMKLNYPVLTAASFLFTAIIVAILLVMYRLENSYNDKIY